jgi:predicted Zn-dependent peptidase
MNLTPFLKPQPLLSLTHIVDLTMKLLTAITATVLLTVSTTSVIAKKSKTSEMEVAYPVVPERTTNARTFYLENGLEVLAVHNPGSPMVGLNLLIRVGSAYEDYSTSGMSHMLEHLLFNGSEKRTQAELYEEVDFYGAYSNAHTDMFYTDFIFLVPAEFLAEGMDIQTDMIFNSILPGDKFEKERGIVMEEIRKDRDRKEWAIGNAFRRMNYGSIGLGLPTIGTLNTIEHLSRDMTFDFYKAHYVPNNMVLTIIGNFDPETLEAQLEQYYGKYSAAPVEPFANTANDVRDGQLFQASGEADKVHGQVVFDVPTIGDDAHLSYQVFVTLFNDQDNDIGAVYHDYPGSGRLIFDFTEETDVDRAETFRRVMETLAATEADLGTLITDAKIDLLHKKQTVEEISLLDSPHYYGMMKAGNVAYVSAAEAITRLDRVAALNAMDVIRDVKGFSKRPHQYNVFTPELKMAADAESLSVSTAKAVLPSGATLVTRSSGGSEMFGMHILIKDRYLLEGEMRGAVEMLHDLLQSGTPEYTAEQIKDEMAAHGATLKAVDMGFIPYDDYYNSADYGYIRFECLAEDAEWGIRFITHLMDATDIGAEDFEKAHKDATDRVRMKGGMARYAVDTTYKKLLLGEGHPFTLAVSGTSESLAKIDQAGLVTLQERYFDPVNYIITISSPLAHEELAGIFNTVWTETGTATERAERALPAGSDKQESIVDMGKEQAQIRLGFQVEVADEDQAAFGVMTSILSYRMMFDLRETRGLAYRLSISSSGDGSSQWLTAAMGTSPATVDEALEGIKSYFDASRLSDLTQREIDKTVNASKGRYMMRNLTRLGQAYYMGYHEYYDGDYQIALQRAEKGEPITPADVQRVAEKYLAIPANHTLVIVK